MVILGAFVVGLDDKCSFDVERKSFLTERKSASLRKQRDKLNISDKTRGHSSISDLF